MKFTKSQLEQAFIELLSKEENPHLFGQAIKRTPEEVLIKQDLKDFLLNQYKAEQITESEVESTIRDFLFNLTNIFTLKPHQIQF